MDTGIYFAGFLVSAAAAVLVIFWLNPRLTVWRVVALLGIGSHAFACVGSMAVVLFPDCCHGHPVEPWFAGSQNQVARKGIPSLVQSWQ